jgi:hypothetical protein
MKSEINTLLAIKSDLEPEINEKDIESHQKGKQPTLYDENEMSLSEYLNNNKYIRVRAHKVSRFDFNHLKSNMFISNTLFVMLLMLQQ